MRFATTFNRKNSKSKTFESMVGVVSALHGSFDLLIACFLQQIKKRGSEPSLFGAPFGASVTRKPSSSSFATDVIVFCGEGL